MWATWAGDPAVAAARWFQDGAPAGINVQFELDGVLEPILGETPLPSDELHSEYDIFVNYEGVETDPEALNIIEEYISNGWL